MGGNGWIRAPLKRGSIFFVWGSFSSLHLHAPALLEPLSTVRNGYLVVKSDTLDAGEKRAGGTCLDSPSRGMVEMLAAQPLISSQSAADL
jgi:hypothetical protein